MSYYQTQPPPQPPVPYGGSNGGTYPIPPPPSSSTTSPPSYYNSPYTSHGMSTTPIPAVPSIHQHSQMAAAQQPNYYSTVPSSYPPQPQPNQFMSPPMHASYPPMQQQVPYGTPLPPPPPQMMYGGSPPHPSMMMMHPPQQPQPSYYPPQPQPQYHSPPHPQILNHQQQLQYQQPPQPQHIPSQIRTPQPLPIPSVQRPLSTSTSTPQLSLQKQPSQTMATIFQDLDSRFIMNLPDEELASFERIMFQLQQAHWFYLDFYADKNSELPRLNYKTFCETMFRHIPSFKVHLGKFEQVYASFNQYLHAVPVSGCILINKERTHCVMVRSWGTNVWGFPRGKLDANEDEITCAIREVDEEIGFDCRAWFKGYEQVGPNGALTRQTSSESTASNTSTTSKQQKEQPSYLEVLSSSKSIRLYILLDVPRNFHFETRTRKEIDKISWVPIDELRQSKQYTFSNTTQMFSGKLRTFLNKLKSGEITGFGIYQTTKQAQPEPPNSNNSNSTSVATPAKKQSKKAPPQSADSNSSTDVKPPKSKERRSSEKSSSTGANNTASFFDAKNAQTFSNGLYDGSSSGWTPEQMFAANAKLGVVTTVQEEKIQLPAHLDAQLNAALGRKQQSQPQQSTNPPNKSGKKGKKNEKSASVSEPATERLPHSTSEPVSIPLAATVKSASTGTPYKPHVPAQELDFGHNPYTTFANLSLHQQSNIAVDATKSAQPKSATVTSPPEPTPPPANRPQSAAKPKKEPKAPRAQKKATNSTAMSTDTQPATAVTPVAPQYRIQKRPTSGASVAPSSSAPSGTSSVPPPSTDFQFDLAAIMEPLHQ